MANPTIVQTGYNQIGGNTSGTVTMGSNITAGSTVLLVNQSANANNITSISGGGFGTNWIKVAGDFNADLGESEVWCGVGTSIGGAGTASIVVDYSSSGSGSNEAWVVEISGANKVVGTSNLSYESTTNTTFVSNPLAVTAGSFLIAFAKTEGGGFFTGSPAGFTAVAGLANNTHAISYESNASAGSAVTASYTLSPADNGIITLVSVSFYSTIIPLPNRNPHFQVTKPYLNKNSYYYVPYISPLVIFTRAISIVQVWADKERKQINKFLKAVWINTDKLLKQKQWISKTVQIQAIKRIKSVTKGNRVTQTQASRPYKLVSKFKTLVQINASRFSTTYIPRFLGAVWVNITKLSKQKQWFPHSVQIQITRLNKIKNSILRAVQTNTVRLSKSLFKSIKTVFVEKAGEIGETLYRLISVAMIFTVKQSKSVFKLTKPVQTNIARLTKLANKFTRVTEVQNVRLSKQKQWFSKATQIQTQRLSKLKSAILRATKVLSTRLSKQKNSILRVVQTNVVRLSKTKTTIIRVNKILGAKITKTKNSTLRSVWVQSIRQSKLKNAVLRAVQVNTTILKKSLTKSIKSVTNYLANTGSGAVQRIITIVQISAARMNKQKNSILRSLQIQAIKRTKLKTTTIKLVQVNNARINKLKSSTIRFVKIQSVRFNKTKSSIIRTVQVNIWAPAIGYGLLLQSLNPTAWWRLADSSTSSTAADSSGNGHTGTNNNATFGAWNPMASSPSQTGASFNGTSSDISTTFNPTLTAFTVIFFINAQGNSQSYTRLLSNDYTGNDSKGFDIYVNGTTNLQLLCSIGNGSTNTILGTENTFSSSGTHMLVVTWNGTTLGAYIDGVVDPYSNSLSGTIPAGTSDLMIGANPTFGPGSYFQGDLAEIAFFSNTALTATQITALYVASHSANRVFHNRFLQTTEILATKTNKSITKFKKLVQINVARFNKQKIWNPKSVFIQSIKQSKVKNAIFRGVQINTERLKKSLTKSVKSVYVQKAGEIGRIFYRLVSAVYTQTQRLSKSLTKSATANLIRTNKINKTKSTNIKADQIKSTRINKTKQWTAIANKVQSVRLAKTKTVILRAVKILTDRLSKLKTTTIQANQVKSTRLSKQKNTNMKAAQVVSATVTRAHSRTRGITSGITYTIGTRRTITKYRQIKAVLVNTFRTNKGIQKGIKASSTNTSSFIRPSIPWKFLVQFVTNIFSSKSQTIDKPGHAIPDPDVWDPNMSDYPTTPSVQGTIYNNPDDDSSIP